MRSSDNCKQEVVSSLSHALNQLDQVISLMDDENNFIEVLRLTRLVREEIQESTEKLIRNYVVECSSRLKGDNSTYYVQEIVKSFRYLN